jgi:hypothetical protein
VFLIGVFNKRVLSLSIFFYLIAFIICLKAIKTIQCGNFRKIDTKDDDDKIGEEFPHVN